MPNSDPKLGSQIVHLTDRCEDYLARKIKEASQAQKGFQKTSINTKSNAYNHKQKPATSNNQKRSWERERDRLEQEITKLEMRQSQIHSLLANDSTYEKPEESLKLVSEQEEIDLDLNTKLSRWEELCMILDQIEGPKN